ncbi:hypothetical protein AUC71_02690 [Methyloceanibacter marginalis]|uniref:Uncharacterized protein n=1 Tax=Methyloceanibacter marginalis TaxID=1774971 RepID=A0A1E3W880_9HYPH|nr:EboA domain-containing protein [Methyloceanibacter marginalis]ODS02035.1 hypothetical protein AUC71_02690 [Methyloceanibacter marginalis]
MTADLDETADRIALLSTWLAPRLTTEQMAWLEDQVTRIRNATGGPALPMAIGLAPRRLGKADLTLDEREMQAAAARRPGLDPTGWSADQTARILFVLASFDGDKDAFAEKLRRLLAQGEVSEHIALLRGLPLYPSAARLVPIATEGLRSNVQPVFEAVAHASPFPRETFSKDQWNQMVLKALFVGSRLAPIQGLDERRNPELAEMLIDYAHERWRRDAMCRRNSGAASAPLRGAGSGRLGQSAERRQRGRENGGRPRPLAERSACGPGCFERRAGSCRRDRRRPSRLAGTRSLRRFFEGEE